jgi:hypothetical protein
MTDTPLAVLGRLVDRLSSLTAKAWSTLRSGMFGSYRPEQHYMRGPGPKCHEKHLGDAGA